MIANVDLDYCEFTESDYNDMYNILENNSEDFLYRASEFIKDRLEDDFDYYFPYIKNMYDRAKELNHS